MWAERCQISLRLALVPVIIACVGDGRDHETRMSQRQSGIQMSAVPAAGPVAEHDQRQPLARRRRAWRHGLGEQVE